MSFIKKYYNYSLTKVTTIITSGWLNLNSLLPKLFFVLLLLPYITSIVTYYVLLAYPLFNLNFCVSSFIGNYFGDLTTLQTVINFIPDYNIRILVPGVNSAHILFILLGEEYYLTLNTMLFNLLGYTTLLHTTYSNILGTVQLWYIPEVVLLYTSQVAILSFGLKFIVIILLLIFVRGGIPRYRYDFLTKMGWFKYFSWVLLFFMLSFGLYIIFS